MVGWRSFLVGWLVSLAAGVGAQPAPPRPLQRLDGRIVLDGRPDEPAWQAIEPLPLTEYAPNYRATPEQRTQIRVGYDDDALYAAGWFHDDDPSGIRINSLYRDRWNGDDAFAIYVDAFDDNLNAKWFGTTPGGIRFDQLVSDDGATLNGSWDGFWEARTTVDGQGWFAEVRIPFSTLGLHAPQGRAVMGLTVTRLVSRTGERVTFPDIDPRFAFRQPSQAADVVLEGVRSETPLYLTPYALGGASQARVLDGNAWRSPGATSGELGLDARWTPSGSLTLDATVNTDFAQVEVDQQQVALDRFPLFFPEKRRFFQEGSDVFDFTTTGGGRLFHSRRIGLTSDRRPLPVLGGLRLVGRIDEWDVGLLGMQTDAQDGTPSENFGVARVRRRVLNPYSYVGAMATSRLGGGHHNQALGLDASFRLFGDDYLSLKLAGTVDDADPDDSDLLERSVLNARWQRRANRGLAYNVDLLRTGGDFRPDLGFLPRSGVTTANVSANWYRFTEGHRFLRRLWPGALAFATFRNEDGVLESGTWAAWMQWDTKAGGGGWVEPKVFLEDVAVAFRIDDEVEIPAGRYTFADLQLYWSMAAGARLRTDVDFRTGTFFDGTRTQIVLSPTWNVSPHLELGATWQLSRLRFDSRGQGSDIHLAGLEVRTAWNARASANAFVQYNSTTERLDLNLRLRYNFAEGSDLWIVYDEGLDTDRMEQQIDVPRAPLSEGRSITVKLTHTFGL